MKTALQLYSVRDEVEKDFEGTLKAVSEFGYDGVEFAGLYGKTPEDVRKLCEKYGLVPVSAHVGIGEMLENENVFSDYKEMGCEYIAIPYIAPEEMSTENDRLNTIEKVRVLSEKAKAVFAVESLAADLVSLAFDPPGKSGLEFTENFFS